MKIGKDKILHFTVCLIATVLSSVPGFFFMDKWQCVYSSLLFPIGLGLGKEYGDSKATGNKWSWGDIFADVIGITCGIGIIGVLYLIVGR